MKLAIFCHSILSDWNHGSAHFLRGIVHELVARGHRVRTFEAKDAWSVTGCVADHGHDGLSRVRDVYPYLRPTRYDPSTLDLDEALEGVNLVLVHDWTPHALVKKIGEHRAKSGTYRLLFHDTHHRAITDPDSMAAYDLSSYDGVLAFGAVLKDAHVKHGWARQAWVWHEAADTRVFRPMPELDRTGDLVWIGDWGDDERTSELEEFLLGPVRALGLSARVYGVRYPDQAKERLREAGIEYGGWVPNYDEPAVFARYRVTVHVPRRKYVRALPGIPTIRPFEALACGVAMVSAPWDDVEDLFTPGEDFLVAKDGEEMARHLRALLGDPEMARALARHGRRSVLSRHTCAHRVEELLGIYASLCHSEQRSASITVQEAS
jgi:spore maturation protein CgeB